MANSSYVPIDVPSVGEDGLSDRQKDNLLSGVARSQNFIGKKLDEHDKEIYGYKEYKGLKGKSHEAPCSEVKRLSKRLWWLIGMLISAGVIGGGAAIQNGIGG